MAIVDVRRLSPMERVWAANILRMVGDRLPSQGLFDTNRLRRTILWKQVDSQREAFINQYTAPIARVLEEAGADSAAIYDRTSSVTSVVNHIEQTLPGRLRPIIRAMYAEVGKYFAQRAAVNTSKAATGEFDPFSDPAMAQWFNASVGAKIVGITDATANEVRALVQREIRNGSDVPTIARKLQSTYGFSKKRALRIARTEVVAASNAGNFFGALANIGLNLVKVWMSTQDDRVRDTHKDANGQKRNIDKPFEINGSDLLFPGDTSLGADPEETIHCRCTLYFERPAGYVSPAAVPVAEPPSGDTPEETRKRILGDTAEIEERMKKLRSEIEADTNTYYQLMKKMDAGTLTTEEARQMEFLTQRLQQLQDTLASLRKAVNNVVERLFQAPGRVRFDITGGAFAKPVVRQRVEEAFRVFEKLIGTRADLMEQVQINIMKPMERAYAISRQSRVFVAANDQIKVIIHELGHVLEFSDRQLKRDIAALFERRTKGEPLVSMKKLFPKAGYDAMELTRVDKWIHPYMGRVYADGATELVSMGLQLMYEDPILLMTKDPELFDILYVALRRGR